MKPTQIYDVMEIAQRARKLGLSFNPLFVGPPGVGKSEIVQAWAKSKKLPLIDLRIAYREAPDMIGFPQPTVNADGRQVTTHFTPDFWPTSGEGVLLLEEPNRGNTSVMNTLMQILTDRKVDKYTLPEGWIIAACINPEGTQYDVNTMDAALKNRFEIFEVGYDKKSFVDYMKANDWTKSIINFVSSSAWTYQAPESIAENAKYISPRTWSRLNAAEKAGIPDKIKLMVYNSILGNNMGKAYNAFANEDAPISFHDIVENKRFALKKLKEHGNPDNYQGDKVTITVEDILDNGRQNQHLPREVFVEVLMSMPAEQGYVLLRDYAFIMEKELKQVNFMDNLMKEYPDLKKRFRQDLK